MIDIVSNRDFAIISKEKTSSSAKDTAAAYMGEAEITDIGNLVSYLKFPPDTPNNAFAVPQSEQDKVEKPPWLSRLGVKLVDDS